jgi:hypothetical protein
VHFGIYTPLAKEYAVIAAWQETAALLAWDRYLPPSRSGLATSPPITLCLSLGGRKEMRPWRRSIARYPRRP